MEYIKNQTRERISFNEIYDNFQTNLLDNEIDNRYFLQGALKMEDSFMYETDKDYIYKE